MGPRAVDPGHTTTTPAGKPSVEIHESRTTTTESTNIDNDLASRRLDSLQCCTLLDALRCDPRPTFVFDVESPVHDGGSRISFINPALQGLPSLCEAVKETFAAGHVPETTFNEQHGTVRVYGREWEHYTVDGRWRVVGTRAHSGEPIPSPSHSRKRSRLPNEVVRDTNAYNGSRTETCRRGSVASHTSKAILQLPKECQEFIALFDWEATAIGPMDTWPPRLFEAYLGILIDPRPASLLFFPEIITIFNAGYIDILGTQYKAIMGNLIADVLPDVYHVTKPMCDQVTSTRRAVSFKGVLASWPRDGGFVQAGYYDWTTMPVFDHNMDVIASLNSAVDSTRSVLEQRRTQTLSSLSAFVNHFRGLENTWDRVTELLRGNEDLPQSLIYSLSSGDDDPSKLECKLEGSVACKQSILLEQFLLHDSSNAVAALLHHSMTTDLPLYLSKRPAYAFSDLWLKHKANDPVHELCSHLPSLLRNFEPSPAGNVCDSVVIIPFKLVNSQKIRGFGIFGVHASLPYDEEYQTFMVLLQQVISAHLTSELLWREAQIASKTAEVAQVADLSARLLRQQEETKSMEARFSQLARHVPIGIAIYTATGALAFANKKWYSLMNFPEDGDKTSPGWWFPLIYPEDLESSIAAFAKFQFDKGPIHLENRLAAPSKQYPSPFTWVLVSMYPELIDGDQLDSIVACFVDITEQKCAAERESRRTKEALEAKRQLEDFIDVTSHEIRNPLSVSLQCCDEISTIAKAKLKGLTPQTSSVHLPTSELQDVYNASEVIQQSIIHQKRIVDDILTVSKMEGGLLTFTLSHNQPLQVAANTLKLFSREFVQAKIEVELQQDASFARIISEQDWLELDPGRLSQVLINLLTNAIKFTKAQNERRVVLSIGASTGRLPLPTCKCSQPTITAPELKWVFIDIALGNLEFLPLLDHETIQIGLDWDPAEIVYVHFLVTDSGSGISAEDQAGVFSRFSQGSHKDYAQFGGSGLGLYICRSLVEIHGGQIGFQSISGQGSKFGFCIKTRRLLAVQETQSIPSKVVHVKSAPKTPDEEIAAFVEDSVLKEVISNGIPSKRLHIMIVEDNLINQKVLSKQLQKKGHDVTIVNHGQECLDALEKSQFCIPDGLKLSVVLMDIEMPIMNGVDCTKEIRRREKLGLVKAHVPVIATTANARSEKVELVKVAGVDDIILKPYSIPDLLALIDGLLERCEREG